MSIYEKLANVQLALMKRDIKKTGYNKFKKYYYHTLDDLMPHCLEECHKQGLTFFFNFRNNEAIIRLHDWENPTDSISCGLPFPELVPPAKDGKNKNNVIVQDVGASVTYLKRYLLIDLFDISEGELIDSELNDASSAETVKNTSSSNNTKPSKKKEDEVKEVPIGKLTLEARDKLVKGGIDENEITPQILKQKILHLQKWTVPERRYIINYFKEQKEKDLGGSK